MKLMREKEEAKRAEMRAAVKDDSDDDEASAEDWD
jgi:hypothetical protein